MWCDVMWCDVMWCDVMWCDVMWCDVMQCKLILSNGTITKDTQVCNQCTERGIRANRALKDCLNGGPGSPRFNTCVSRLFEQCAPGSTPVQHLCVGGSRKSEWGFNGALAQRWLCSVSPRKSQPPIIRCLNAPSRATSIPCRSLSHQLLVQQQQQLRCFCFCSHWWPNISKVDVAFG